MSTSAAVQDDLEVFRWQQSRWPSAVHHFQDLPWQHQFQGAANHLFKQERDSQRAARPRAHCEDLRQGARPMRSGLAQQGECGLS